MCSETTGGRFLSRTCRRKWNYSPLTGNGSRTARPTQTRHPGARRPGPSGTRRSWRCQGGTGRKKIEKNIGKKNPGHFFSGKKYFHKKYLDARYDGWLQGSLPQT